MPYHHNPYSQAGHGEYRDNLKMSETTDNGFIVPLRQHNKLHSLELKILVGLVWNWFPGSSTANIIQSRSKCTPTILMCTIA